MRSRARLIAAAVALLGCGTGAASRPGAGPPAVMAAQAKAPAPAAPKLMSPADLDRLVEAMWAEAHAAPAPAASDAELLRRTTLDVVGRVPTLDEAEAFLHDRDPGKRVRLVDRLLGSPEYAEHWAG